MRLGIVRRSRSVLAVFLAIVAVQLPTLALADSLTVTVMNARIPAGGGCVSPAVAGDDANAYYFRDFVFRYDASTDRTTWTGVRVPQSCTAAAIWDGEGHAFIFGGQMPGGKTNAISRYDAASNTLSTMGATLPEAISFSSAVWTDQYAYSFGGALEGPCSGSGCPYTDRIVRYDPRTDTATLMNGRLPSPRINMSAVWDGRNVYLFGGCCTYTVPGTSGWSQIVRYDPATDTIAVMAAALPDGRYYASAVMHGGFAYLFGGTVVHCKCGPDNLFLDDILRYDPARDVLTVESARLPSGRSHTTAVVIDEAAYIFGGLYWDHTPPYEHPLNELVRVQFGTAGADGR